jgi:hypothetical protein
LAFCVPSAFARDGCHWDTYAVLLQTEKVALRVI